MIRNIVQWSNTAKMAPNVAYERSLSNYQGVRPAGKIDSADGLNFTVFGATGGKVVQFSTYDVARDRTVGSLYIVTDKEDLGEELGQIITKESLSRSPSR
jgi:hypothetical protein